MKNGIAPLGIVVAMLLVGIWELIHLWWFWIVCATLAVALGVSKYVKKHQLEVRYSPPLPTTVISPTITHHVAQPFMVIGDDYVRCQNFMSNGDWDAARRQLQQIAYSMVSASPTDKARFTELMKTFATQDPLFSGVLRIVMPIVREQPGILQTAIYKHIPGIGVEEARYTLYFAEQLGILKREKKGNTYKLLPASEIIDVT